MLVVLGELMGF